MLRDRCRRFSTKRDPAERAEAAANYYKSHAEAVNKRVKQYRADNPLKHAAHLAVKRATYSGKLVKPPTCSKCSKTKFDAHHDDYLAVLMVKWLCRQHHRERHSQLRREGKDPDV